jgi:hypothetical protein
MFGCLVLSGLKYKRTFVHKYVCSVLPVYPVTVGGMTGFHTNRSWWRTVGLGVLLAAWALFLVVPDAWAAGNDVGRNLGDLLKRYAGEVYGGLAGISSLFFLWHRRYSELATFLLAAIVVAWMVFAPSTIGDAAKAIAQQIFG